MTEFEKDILFEHISGLVLQRYIKGFDPNWQFTFLDISHSEISDGTIRHIAKQIKNGFTNGEIQEDEKQGWWFLKMDSPDWKLMENYIKSTNYSKAL